MINIYKLSKRFGNKVVYDNADITVESESICGLVGINGAGKSTLLRLLSGVLKPDSGCILIDGDPVYDNPKVKKDIFFLPDDPYYDSGVTGMKLRELYKTFYPFDDEVFQSYTTKFNLNMQSPIRNFSKGMKRQLFIAAALACSPKYLFLDEAFDGLDPLARLEFKRGLIKLQESGSTVIIASHSLRELEDICDSFVLVDNNAVKVCGKIENALENMFKFQLVFANDVEAADLPFECVQFTKTGRVITAVGRGKAEEAKARLEAMNPVVMEEIPMDFEDMFIEEVQSRGYLK